MGTESAPVLQSAVAEDPVADLEGGDAAAGRLDVSGESLPRTVPFGLMTR